VLTDSQTAPNSVDTEALGFRMRTALSGSYVYCRQYDWDSGTSSFGILAIREHRVSKLDLLPSSGKGT
jgi:hypothetical protein